MTMDSNVRLLQSTSLKQIIDGIRTCYLSEGNSDSTPKFCPINYVTKYRLGDKDKELLLRIIEHGHTSTLEHSLFTFKLYMSRGCLQELARHRIGTSLSVQSTRYTLKKILRDDIDLHDIMVPSGNSAIDDLAFNQLLDLRTLLLDQDIPNDVAKYAIPEALKIEATASFNLRSLMHFVNLRDNEKAHFEIRKMAQDMVESLPEEYKFLFLNDK